uniref:DUF6531 domain-containing protein n=1 Tax=Anaerophilus nitritogenes TaxID=2498136 RepID=UPI001FAA2CB9
MLVTYKGFKIDLPYDILQVEYMALEEKINEHIRLDLKVLVEEDKVLEYINQPVTGTKVIVKEYNEHIKREVPIFQGKITNLKIEYHGQLHVLELSCISFTHDFDIKKNNRTFYDLDLTYKDVIKNVLSSYPKKDFQDMVTKNQKINHFLLQYEETDWEFIKRLATHFEALLLPDAGASFGRMYFGLPKLNNNVEICKKDYTILKDLEKYKKDKGMTKEKIMTQDYTSWEIETDRRLYLGEEVILNNIKCQVTRVWIHTYKEDIQYIYKLEVYKGVRSVYTTNPKIFGMSLPAIVKERKGNSVRVHFEIDDTYIKKPNNKYFTYALESSSWYCMPVEESKVHIYFPTNNEKDAIAIHAIRIAASNEKYYHKTINPDHKSFSNTTGSEMKMTPKDISFAVDDAKAISLMLKKSGDINIKGDNITLKAASNVNFGVRELPPDAEGEPLRPKNITMSAKESFIITRNEDPNHSIDMMEKICLTASFVKMYGILNNPPSIPASAYDQSANDSQLIDQYNAGAKQALVNKMNDAKSKVGIGTIALGIGIGAVFVAATVLTGGATIGVLAVGASLSTTGALAVGGVGLISAAVGFSEMMEGRQDYTKGQSGDFSESYNLVRDGLFGGNKDIYNVIKYGAMSTSALGVGLWLGGSAVVNIMIIKTGISTLSHLGFDFLDDGKINNGEEYYVKNGSVDMITSLIDTQLDIAMKLNELPGKMGSAVRIIKDSLINSGGDIATTGEAHYIENLIGAGIFEIFFSPKPSNCKYDGDPVNVATGSLYVPATDLVLSDIKSEFKIERKYNSVNKRVGILGKGWTFNYESNLQVENDRAAILCTDGHIETFYQKDEVWENHKGSSNNYRLDFDSWKNEYRFKDISKKLIYVYNENGQLIKIIDKNNNEMIITYKGSSIHTLKTFSNYMLDFIYENGKIVQIKDEIGRTVQYKYDGDYLTHVVHVDYGITKYEYDEKGYIKAITDQNGNVYTINEFDQEGRVTYQKYSTGDTCTITYDDKNRETQFYFSESKRSKKYKYNRDYLVTHTYYEDDTYEEYDYDQYQNKIFEKDRNGQIIKRKYNTYGNVIKEELSNGLMIHYDYDENQNLIKKSDNNGGEQLYTYNLQGNIIEQRNKIAVGIWQTEKYEYDIYGRVIKRIDPLGNSKNFDYEIGERILPEPSRIKDSEENIYEYTYDKLGRNTSIKTKYGEVEFGYNRLNYITYIKDAKGNVTRKYYDKMGNLIRFVTPNNYNPDFDNGEAYEYKYDSMDRLIQMKDPLGNIVKNIRDTEGNIIKEINPNDYDFSTKNGIGIEYVYDKDNRKIKIIYPDGGVERFFYDSEGNIIKHVTSEYYDVDLDDGLGYSYQYDSMNRLIAIIDPKGEVEKKYQYDLYGNISHEIDKQGNTTLFKYDFLGNLLEKREPVDQVGEEAKYKITVYEYDKNGNKIKEKYGKESVGQKDYPQYYHEIFFTYDKNNRLIRVKDKYGAKVEYR